MKGNEKDLISTKSVPRNANSLVLIGSQRALKHTLNEGKHQKCQLIGYQMVIKHILMKVIVHTC